VLAPGVLDAEGAGPASLGELIPDPLAFVRLRAAEALARCGTRPAAGMLVRFLEAEEEEPVAVRIVELLQRLSGRDHQRDVSAWSEWAEGLNPLWRPGGGVRTGSGPAAPTASAATTFAGLPIVSRRIAFLIDLSGSIWNERSDGKTRKEKIDDELERALEGLPSDACFNVVPYTSKPIPWDERLVPATALSVKRATAFFEDLQATGSGNFWDAALYALADPRVDTLVVLTDGVPTGGRRTRLELIVPLFIELNEWRRVAVDSILIDAPRREREAWARLAELTGGRSQAISHQ
jgi:hypothetical protein